MRLFGVLFVIGIFMLGLGCATVDVAYDFDPEADFSALHTYGWQPIPKRSKADAFVIKRIKAAVAQEMDAKGFRESESAPDFTIALHGSKERKVDVQEWGYSYSPRAYYHPYGFRDDRPGGLSGPRWGRGEDYEEYRSGTDVYEYEEGTLIIDIVDAKKKELLWRGSATDVIDPLASPEERTRTINETVKSILVNFPPGAKIE